MIGKLLRRSAKVLARRSGFEIIQASLLYDWQIVPAGGRSHTSAPLPPGAAEYLRADNPRLAELRERYAKSTAAVTKSLVWTEQYLVTEDLAYFRGDNPYVFQLRGRNMNELSYVTTYFASKSTDHLKLLDRVDEDQLFGIHTFEVEQRFVSRDLLDSIAELNFLERQLEVSKRSDIRILDIGAGYGRLAHRATKGVPSIRTYFCTDAVPQSSFICEFYLQFRGVDDRAKMLPLDEVESMVSIARIDVAVNVHSFSECSLESIEWWIALLKRNRVPRLMIVPNLVAADGSTMLTNAREDFSRIVTSAGYRLLANEPKYLDPMVQKYGINPARHLLFGLD